MGLIDSAQLSDVVIVARSNGGGGDWTALEVYPIVLGWGVELDGSGINFWDNLAVAGKPNKAVFDIAPFSANDTVGHASIYGTVKGTNVKIGSNGANGKFSIDTSMIKVESGEHLYLALANVNGSVAALNTAITVAGGGALTLGIDHDQTEAGPVVIGNAQRALDGYNGIVCGGAGATKACTIDDATLMGQSTVTIEGQEGVDIDAEDMASITLTAQPVIGIAPGVAGIGKCGAKTDAATAKQEAVLLRGSASVTFDNGTLSCISGQGFHLQASAGGNPTLTVDSTTIQNTEGAVVAQAGSATITNSTIQFNVNGVEQNTDGINVSSINLSGSAAGGNTVICSSNAESIQNQPPPGVDVLNTTTGTLNASFVAWDTTGPDQFTCNAQLAQCACVATCTNTAGNDDMDSVNTNGGAITVTGNTQSAVAVAAHCN